MSIIAGYVAGHWLTHVHQKFRLMAGSLIAVLILF